jgi:hypothetical protein
MNPSSVSNSDLWHEAFPIVDAFDEQLHQTGIGNAQLVLAAFLVTFLIVRTITHMIKAGKGPFGNISVGGTHLHHLVPGIFLLLISGTLGIAWNPSLPATVSWIIPVMFGIGAALTLDEFALWLTLKDVYWEKQGRRSVDAVIIAATMFALVALGAGFWMDIIRNTDEARSWWIIGYHLIGLAFATVCFLKGKWIFAALGLALIPFSAIGAIRLARPNSQWARRSYGTAKMAAATERYPGQARMPRWPWQTPSVPMEDDLVGDGTTTA